MAVVTREELITELRAELRRRGHNVDVDITERDDGAHHIHIHIRGPLWWYVTRWLLTLPTRPLPLLLSRLDDVVAWHVVRGHNVGHNVTMGEASGPLHMWNSYCHTCEVAW